MVLCVLPVQLYCLYCVYCRRAFINGSFYDALVINYRFHKTPWVLYSQV